MKLLPQDPAARAARLRMLALAAVLATCALQRVWLIANAEVLPPDSAVYLGQAQAWARDHREAIATHRQHPGYAASIAWAREALLALGAADGRGLWEAGGLAVSSLSSLAALAGVYLLGRRAFGAPAGLVGVLLFGLGRKWAAVSSQALSDPPAVALQVYCALAALWTASLLDRPGRRAIGGGMLTGALAGLGYLVRAEAAAMLLPGLAVWLARRGRRPMRWATAGAAMAAALAMMLPYMLAVGGLTRRLEAVPTAWLARPGVLASLAASDYFVLRQFSNMLVEAMSPVAAGAALAYVLLACARRVRGASAPGWLVRAGAWPRRDCWVLAATAAVVIGAVVSAWYVHSGILDERYLMSVAALLAPAAGAGAIGTGLAFHALLAKALGRLGDGRLLRMYRAMPAWAVAALVPAGLVVGNGLNSMRVLNVGYGCYRQAGEIAAGLARDHDVLLADTHWTVYYAGMPRHATLYERQGDFQPAIFLRRAEDLAATFVVVADVDAAANPRLREVLQPPAFVEIASIPAGRGPRPNNVVRVYRTVGWLFSDEDYLADNPDVAEAVARGEYRSAFEHYALVGAGGGRPPSRLFEEAYYLRENPLAAQAVAAGQFACGLSHYLAVGADEKLDCSEAFSEADYLARHADVAAAVAAGQLRCGLEHYMRFGRREGRAIR